MKVIIPCDEDKEKICQAFARAPYFALYDTENKTLEYKDNPAANAESGAGIKAAQAVIDFEIDVLITKRLGENSAEVIKEAEIKIYKAENDDLKDNIQKFENGELSELTKFHAGYHGLS